MRTFRTLSFLGLTSIPRSNIYLIYAQTWQFMYKPPLMHKNVLKRLK
jgi:hypothetical protein